MIWLHLGAMNRNTIKPWISVACLYYLVCQRKRQGWAIILHFFEYPLKWPVSYKIRGHIQIKIIIQYTVRYSKVLKMSWYIWTCSGKINQERLSPYSFFLMESVKTYIEMLHIWNKNTSCDVKNMLETSRKHFPGQSCHLFIPFPCLVI